MNTWSNCVLLLTTTLMLVPPELMITKTINIIIIMRVHDGFDLCCYFDDQDMNTGIVSCCSCCMIFAVFSLPAPFECWAESF